MACTTALRDLDTLAYDYDLRGVTGLHCRFVRDDFQPHILNVAKIWTMECIIHSGGFTCHCRLAVDFYGHYSSVHLMPSIFFCYVSDSTLHTLQEFPLSQEQQATQARGCLSTGTGIIMVIRGNIGGGLSVM
jgi:hypothetical protein